MLFINILLSIFLLFSSINLVNAKSYKNDVTVEKSDVLTLKFSENNLGKDNIVPSYFIEPEVEEYKIKGLTTKKTSKNFDTFMGKFEEYIKYLDNEIKKLENNSQAFSSEYLFHRKNYIRTKIDGIYEIIDNMTIKDKKKLNFYVYKNRETDKYDSLLGVSIIYGDKDNPFLIGTVVMPDYIGKLEPFITAKSIDIYKVNSKVLSERISTIPLNYFDRYFLNSVGFK